MKKLSLIILLSALCIYPSGQLHKADDSLYIHSLFEKAENYFNSEEATEQTDSIALSLYQQVCTKASSNNTNALLLFNCYERAGILMEGLGYTSQEALKEFYKGVNIHRSFHLPDSILFRLYLSAGNAHYITGLFDSCVFYFSSAEKIIDQYPDAGHAEDLYNSLGALYSESGDYTQSIHYFSKALEIIKSTRPGMDEAAYAMSMNIASALRLTGKADSAVSLYKQLFTPGIDATPLYNNLARIYLSKNKPDSAVYYLNKIQQVQGQFAIAYHNSLALAFMQKNDTVNAFIHLNKARDIYKQQNTSSKNNYAGNTFRYFGDLNIMQGKLQQALTYYQQALIQLQYNFNDTDVYKNPENFMGSFASYDLLEAMLAKAKCFVALTKENQDTEYFNAAINTYNAAFALADYIKKSIDNDESRTFMADKVFKGYAGAADFLLSKYDKTKDEELLQQALIWVNKSRAASLAISLKENNIKKFAGLPDSLLQQENNLRLAISRLYLQWQQDATDEGKKTVMESLNSKQLELHKLISSYKNYPSYYNQKYAADTLDIQKIQKDLPDDKTAVLNFYSGEDHDGIFIIKSHSLDFVKLDDDSLIKTNISFANQGLQNQITKDKAAITRAEKFLYKKIFSPASPYLQHVQSLIIITGDEFANFPFETLIEDDGDYLVNKYDITYQYSLSFLQKETSAISVQKMIAFAPFITEDKNSNENFAVLPFSKEEILTAPEAGRFAGNAATKNIFLQKASGAGIIHLATHAQANTGDEKESFIAFYPVNKNDSSYKLFAHELYAMQLPQTHLVFLSACETGAGKISQSEGVLSLSRAFSYCGCPNIITSLWNAEDVSTAYISNHFYKYLDEGYTVSKALQHAKIDLLQDASMSQFHAPQYWSHLIFIGNMQATSSYSWLWWVMGIGIIITGLFFYIKKRKLSKPLV